MANPQKENGYVPIANEIVDKFCSYRLSGGEWQLLFVVLRKTYGFNKKKDHISLSQFSRFTSLKRTNVVRSLNKLVTKKILTVIKKDTSVANLYQFNKNFDEWKLVTRKRPLVTKKFSASDQIDNQLVTKQRHTKDIYTKDIYTKDITTNVVKEYGNSNINWLIKEFELLMGFKPMAGKKDRLFGNHLIKNFSKEQLTYMLRFCSDNEYAPRVGSLEKLWFKRGDIIAGIKSTKDNSINILKL